MTEIKPCPCCGPKAFITPSTKCDPQAGKHCWTAELKCRECGLNISRTAATEKEALYEAIKAWNTSAERTCTNVYAGREFECSECGMQWHLLDREDEMEEWAHVRKPSYCPSCGAKVVK